MITTLKISTVITQKKKKKKKKQQQQNDFVSKHYLIFNGGFSFLVALVELAISAAVEVGPLPLGSSLAGIGRVARTIARC